MQNSFHTLKPQTGIFCVEANIFQLLEYEALGERVQQESHSVVKQLVVVGVEYVWEIVLQFKIEDGWKDLMNICWRRGKLVLLLFGLGLLDTGPMYGSNVSYRMSIGQFSVRQLLFLISEI